MCFRDLAIVYRPHFRRSAEGERRRRAEHRVDAMGLRGAQLLRAFIFLCLSGMAWSVSTDREILRVVSTELKGHGSIWNTSHPDPCSWAGVQCYGDRITNLTLQRLRLSGFIPSSFSLFQALTILDLSRNSLTGSIPANLSNCRSLYLLNLSFNSLSGSIPAQLQKLRRLQSLDLSANFLSGRIPNGLGNLSALQILNLASNSIIGLIPSDFGNLLALEDLSLAQNLLNGTIPEVIGNLSKLQRFSAYQNSLEGPMPRMHNRNSLQWVNLASNRLSGTIPESICASRQLRVLTLTNNSFVGTLPENLGSCATLSALRLGNNLLTGVIPHTFGQLGNLTYFEANGNKLTGQIPSAISGWENLSLLNLDDNSLSGNIPVELSEVSSLQELRLSRNRLTGEIPEGLSQCKLLSVLDLSENNLSGSIPDDLCKVSKLVYLRLEGNSFAGPIPSTIGDCQQLLELQLSDNKFTDSIPPTIGNLSNLQVSLNLSFNKLTGTIPASLGSLSKLVSLDLSHNELSGEIPSLVNMVSLLDWNFSNNFLTGPVPRIGSTLNSSLSSYASSYANNSGLCGGPLPFCHYNASLKSIGRRGVISVWKVAGIAVSCAIVTLMIFSGIAGGVMCKRHLSSTVDSAPQLMFSHVFMDNFEQAISFESIKEATRSNANVISTNHFSKLYKAVMPSGLVIAVKKLHSTEKGLVAYQKKMALELDKLFRLSHENIMRPVGYAIQNDYAIILYDFVPLCSLGQHLHGNDEQSLSWAMRYEIALGAANALSFLHHSCHPPMVHMDVNSNNIFLGSHFEVKVGDVEVAKLMDPTKNTGSISAVAGSLGYIAPEYAFTMQVTQACNVYSFGVILLELLTGRLPIDETFGDGLDLVRWVHEASSRGETPEQILDDRVSTFSFATRQEMLAVLKVALQCTNATPLRRPRMKKVLEMLWESRLQGKGR